MIQAACEMSSFVNAFWLDLYEQSRTSVQAISDAVSAGAVQKQTSAVEYKTALIAAGVTLAGILLKDLVLKLFHENRVKKENLKAVYARYADPLSSATVSLMWRLHETLDQPGRGMYLKLIGVPEVTNKYNSFSVYKKLSTLYRLAALLGWITACRREFSYLRIADSDSIEPIESAISEFEHALADGPIVEIERLEKLRNLWGLEASLEKRTYAAAAVEVEAAIHEYMQHSNVTEISQLTDEQKTLLIGSVACAITHIAGTTELPDSLLAQSRAGAIEILDIKEAWIYRDWQSAIGDLMLKPIDRSERRFDVIGFSEFESICTQGTDEQKRWIARLSAVFDGIDLSRKDPFDHRPDQLSSVLSATASLTLALAQCVENRSLSQKSC